jgi:cyclophilin family peptidyl-prolyl cis-trans isomerase
MLLAGFAAVFTLGAGGCGSSGKGVTGQTGAPNKGEEIAVITTSLGVIKVKFFPQYAPKAVENFMTHAKNGYYDGVIFHRVLEGFMIQSGNPNMKNGDPAYPDLDYGLGGESIWGEGFGPEVTTELHHIRGALSMAQSSQPNSIGSQFYIVQNDGLDTRVSSWFDKMKRRPDDTYMDLNGKFARDDSGKFYMNKDRYKTDFIDYYLENGGVPFLDYGYTVFGQVIEGMDVVDKIAAVEVIPNVNNDPYFALEGRPVEEVWIVSVTIEKY